MSWGAAALRALLIVAFLVLTTVWLPDRVAHLGAVEGASRALRDLAVTATWAAGLAGGIWLLRIAQRRGRI